MRAAGCVVNDFADRRVDGHVKRTAHRPLPSGAVTEKESKILFVAGCLAKGQLTSKEHIVEGLESFPESLMKLFSGENFGKLVLKL